MKFRGPDGRKVQRSTGYRVGEEKAAHALLDVIVEKLKVDGTGSQSAPPSAGTTPTVQAFAKQFIEDRRADGIDDWKNDESRLRNHVLPTIGKVRLDEVRPKDVRALARTWRRSVKGGGMAPRTLHNIYGTLRLMFKEALIEDHIEVSPCILTSKQLGPLCDKDPEWRETAVYARHELAMLLFDDRIPEDRRVLYGLEGLSGLRHGEAAGLRLRHYDPDREPLGRLMIATSYKKGRTKTRITRYVPVHPVLAGLLEPWLAEGWERMMGRAPGPDDLVVPRPPEHARRQRALRDPDGMRDKNYSRKCLMSDLGVLGLRHRRGHDLRRTMISLARSDGARRDLLERVTHSPKDDRSIDMYTTFEWEAVCDEVAKLKIGLPKDAEVIPLRRAVGSRLVAEPGAEEPSWATSTATSTPSTR